MERTEPVKEAKEVRPMTLMDDRFGQVTRDFSANVEPVNPDDGGESDVSESSDAGTTPAAPAKGDTKRQAPAPD